MSRARSLALATSQIFLGALLIMSSGALTFAILPQSLGPSAGQETSLTEEIRYWSPEDGWQQGVRTRTVQVQEDQDGLTFQETIEGPHSPRGQRFSLPIDDAYELTNDEGVRASFPPTPYLRKAPTHVYLAVPWKAGGQDYAGAIDNLTLVADREQDGLRVLEYQARHTAQFYVPQDGLIWYRAVTRTVHVEAITGTVLDHSTHETLWQETFPTVSSAPLPWIIQSQLKDREKVWEAHITPVDAEVEEQAEEAKDRVSGYHWRMAAVGIPMLILGEVLVWRGARLPFR